MNYKIITDKERLREFINWLPDLLDGEKYYCSLFARKKYAPQMVQSSDKVQLKRFLSNKKDLFNKIQKLEVKKGTYILQDKIVPQEALVLYINPNPRNLYKATMKATKKFMDLVFNQNKGYNPVVEVLSCIQQTPSRKIYHDFDIDTFNKSYDISYLATALNNFIGKDSYKILETRGGFHILIEYSKIPESIKKSWFKVVNDMINRYFPGDVDQNGDMMIPIPGTYQGDFTPKFLN